MHARILFWWRALALAALVLAAPASAQPAAPKVRAALHGDARVAFDRGAALYARGEYRSARDAFVEAHAASGEPRVLYNVAVCDKALGHYLAATEALRTSISNPREVPAAYVRLTTDTLAVIERKLAQLRIETTVGADLFVDGIPAQALQAVDPGRHVVEARLAGYQDARAPVEVTEGERLTVRLPLEREPPPPAAAPRPARLRVITADPADRIRLNGVLQPGNRLDVSVKAGEHRVEVHRTGAMTRELELVLQPGETRDLRITLIDRSAPKAWPWFVAGAGVLVTGAILTAVLLSTRSTEYVGATPGVLAPGVVTASVPYAGAAR